MKNKRFHFVLSVCGCVCVRNVSMRLAFRRAVASCGHKRGTSRRNLPALCTATCQASSPCCRGAWSRAWLPLSAPARVLCTLWRSCAYCREGGCKGGRRGRGREGAWGGRDCSLELCLGALRSSLARLLSLVLGPWLCFAFRVSNSPCRKQSPPPVPHLPFSYRRGGRDGFVAHLLRLVVLVLHARIASPLVVKSRSRRSRRSSVCL